MATGLGKTVVFSNLTSTFPDHAAQGMLVIAHTEELVFQAAEKLHSVNPWMKVGIEKANYNAAIDADIVVAGIATIGKMGLRRLKRFLNRIGIVVIDEAHRVKTGGQYARVLNAYGLGDKPGEQVARPLPGGLQRLSLGFTATPNRHDGRGLKKFYDSIPCNLDWPWGAGEGWLVDPEPHREMTGTDLDKARISAGDFGAKSLAEITDNDKRNMVIVAGYKKAMLGKLRDQEFVPNIGKAIAFVSTVDHAHNLAATFNANGVIAAAVDGETDKEERKDIIAAFKEREIDVLCNVGVFTHGFDDPEVDIILGSRPTKSTSLYKQMVGRGSRTTINPPDTTAEERLKAIAESEKPSVIVIDFVDNTKIHSNIATIPSLAGFRNDFEAKGKKIFTVAKAKADQVKKKNNRKLVYMAPSFEDLELASEKVTAWELEHNDGNKARTFSKLKWVKAGDNAFQIEVPLSKDRFILRIEGDHMNRWKSYQIRGGKVREGKNVIVGFDNAISACDKFIKDKAPSCMKMLTVPRGRKKSNKKATVKMMRYLRKLGLNFPEGMTLPMSEASDLISRAKALQTNQLLDRRKEARSKKV